MVDQSYLDNTRKLFRYYRDLGDKALAQIGDDHIHWQPSPEGNSVAVIVKHLSGNMLSRFSAPAFFSKFFPLPGALFPLLRS